MALVDLTPPTFWESVERRRSALLRHSRQKEPGHRIELPISTPRRSGSFETELTAVDARRQSAPSSCTFRAEQSFELPASLERRTLPSPLEMFRCSPNGSTTGLSGRPTPSPIRTTLTPEPGSPTRETVENPAVQHPRVQSAMVAHGAFSTPVLAEPPENDTATGQNRDLDACLPDVVCVDAGNSENSSVRRLILPVDTAPLRSKETSASGETGSEILDLSAGNEAREVSQDVASLFATRADKFGARCNDPSLFASCLPGAKRSSKGDVPSWDFFSPHSDVRSSQQAEKNHSRSSNTFSGFNFDAFKPSTEDVARPSAEVERYALSPGAEETGIYYNGGNDCSGRKSIFVLGSQSETNNAANEGDVALGTAPSARQCSLYQPVEPSANVSEMRSETMRRSRSNFLEEIGLVAPSLGGATSKTRVIRNQSANQSTQRPRPRSPTRSPPSSPTIGGIDDISPVAFSATRCPSSPFQGKTRLSGGGHVFLVDNSRLKAETLGLGYRKTTRIQDHDPNVGAVPWGTCIRGVEVDEGWVQVGDLYLPSVIQGTRILMPQPAGELYLDIHAANGARDGCNSLWVVAKLEGKIRQTSTSPSSYPVWHSGGCLAMPFQCQDSVLELEVEGVSGNGERKRIGSVTATLSNLQSGIWHRRCERLSTSVGNRQLDFSLRWEPVGNPVPPPEGVVPMETPHSVTTAAAAATAAIASRIVAPPPLSQSLLPVGSVSGCPMQTPTQGTVFGLVHPQPLAMPTLAQPQPFEIPTLRPNNANWQTYTNLHGHGPVSNLGAAASIPELINNVASVHQSGSLSQRLAADLTTNYPTRASAQSSPRTLSPYGWQQNYPTNGRFSSAGLAGSSGSFPLDHRSVDDQTVKQLLLRSLMHAENRFERMSNDWKKLQEDLKIASSTRRRAASTGAVASSRVRDGYRTSRIGRHDRGETQSLHSDVSGSSKGEEFAFSACSEPSFGNNHYEAASHRRHKGLSSRYAFSPAEDSPTWTSRGEDDDQDIELNGSAIITQIQRPSVRHGEGTSIALQPHDCVTDRVERNSAIGGMQARRAALETCVEQVRDRRMQRQQRMGHVNGKSRC